MKMAFNKKGMDMSTIILIILGVFILGLAGYIANSIIKGENSLIDSVKERMKLGQTPEKLAIDEFDRFLNSIERCAARTKQGKCSEFTFKFPPEYSIKHEEPGIGPIPSTNFYLMKKDETALTQTYSAPDYDYSVYTITGQDTLYTNNLKIRLSKVSDIEIRMEEAE